METVFLSENFPTAIARAVAVLRAGGLVVYPTETTYGIGADATNPQAVEKLYRYKSQRAGKPFSIVVTSQEMAEEFVELNQTAKNVYATFLPGPVTVISMGKHVLAPGVESETGTLAVRIPDHEVPIELVRQLGKPITATSANASNQKRPYTIQDILDNTSAQQQSLIDLAIDAGTLPPNPPSTVIDTTLESLQVVRQGEIPFAVKNEFVTHSVAETTEFGRQLVQRYKSFIGYQPVIFALEGEMGVGKTHLTKGLATGLGITELITSPTYSLMEEYQVQLAGKTFPFLHIDAWRLEKPEEMAQLTLEEYLTQNAVVSLEWANSQADFLKKWQQRALIVWISLTYQTAENDRLIRLADSLGT